MRAGVVVLVLALSGCFQSPFGNNGSTVDFTCAMMDPAEAQRVLIEAWVDPALDYNPGSVMNRLPAVLANLTGRSPAIFSVALESGPLAPAGGWNESTLEVWGDEPYLDRGVLRLRILWTDSYSEDPSTGLVAAPGAVVLAMSGIHLGALRLGLEADEAAFAVLLHQVGHALGQVNLGVPVQARDIQEREGPATHDKDPASVLHAGWDDGRTMVWSANATYDGYNAAALADWAGARQPNGVCA